MMVIWSMRPWESARPQKKVGPGADCEDRMDQITMVSGFDGENVNLTNDVRALELDGRRLALSGLVKRSYSGLVGVIPIRLGNDHFVGSGLCGRRSAHVERCNFFTLFWVHFPPFSACKWRSARITPSLGAGAVSLMLMFSQPYPAILTFRSMRSWESARHGKKLGKRLSRATLTKSEEDEINQPIPSIEQTRHSEVGLA